MIVRQATDDECEALRCHTALAHVDVTPGRTWVAVEGETILGVLPLRLCWNAEPLLILPGCASEPAAVRRRATLMLYLAAEEWVRDPTQNRNGPRWLFAISYSRELTRWAAKLGWFRIYRHAQFWIRHLPPIM